MLTLRRELRGRCSLQHGSVFSSGDVRGELVAIVASVPTHVTLKRVTKTMAPHVDGEHHVIEEEDVAVVTPKHIHHLPFLVDHFDGVPQADGRGFEEFKRARDLLQKWHPVAGLGEDHVALLVDVILAILVVAVSVCGVLGTVIGGQTSFRRHDLLWQEDPLLLQLLWSPIGHIGPSECYGVHAADDWDHLRGGSRWSLDQGAEGFGPEIADGVIDGLVHHPGLHHLVLLLVHVAGIVVGIKAVPLLTWNRREGGEGYRRNSGRHTEERCFPESSRREG